jgi:replicative DNA helicase
MTEPIALADYRPKDGATARQLPANIEVEQAFLGSLMLHNDIFSFVAGFLKAEHFSEEAHRRIYATASVLIGDGKTASPVTLRTFLGAAEVAPGTTFPAYLAHLCVDACAPVAARDYAQTIRDLFTRREIITATQEVQEQAFDAPADVRPSSMAAAVLDRLGELTEDAASSKRSSAGDSAHRVVAHAQLIREGKAVSTGVSTGFSDLDTATGGYRPGELWIVAARPGVGKTVYAVTSATKASSKGAGAQIFSLEVPEDQFTARILADMAFNNRRAITFQNITRGLLDDEDMWRLDDAQRALAKMPLVVDYSSRLTIAEIKARVHVERKRMTARGSVLGVVFIDYLKFIQASDRYRGNRVYEVGEISAGLKQLSKDEGVCIVLLAQLNRALESREDKRPGLSDLRESGDLEADADVVAFLHREAYFLEKSPMFRANNADALAQHEIIKNDAELIIGKNRSGPTRTVKLFCDVSCSTMTSKAWIG